MNSINKKGAGFFNVLMYILVALLVLTIIIYLYVAFKTGSEKQIEKEACKRSVQGASMFKLRISGVQLIDDLGRAVPLKCYTQYNTVAAGKETQAISYALYNCWNQFNQGRSEIFDTKNNNYCVVCSRLEFDKKTKVTGLTGYLIDTKIPGRKETYFEFLSAYKADGKVKEEYENSNLKNIESIDTSVPQAVVFVMEKNAVSQGPAGTAIGVGVGLATIGVFSLSAVATGGAAVPLWVFGAGALGSGSAGYFFGSHTGATNYDAVVLIAPYDELSSLKCTRLEGHAKPLEAVSSTLDSK